MGYLAGKWPHSLALHPGGTTRALTAAEKVRVLTVLRECRAFLSETLFGDTLENVTAIASVDQLAAWARDRPADFPRFPEIADDLGLDRIGRASDRFLSYGAYGQPGRLDHGGQGAHQLFARGMGRPARCSASSASSRTSTPGASAAQRRRRRRNRRAGPDRKSVV